MCWIPLPKGVSLKAGSPLKPESFCRLIRLRCAPGAVPLHNLVVVYCLQERSPGCGPKDFALSAEDGRRLQKSPVRDRKEPLPLRWLCADDGFGEGVYLKNDGGAGIFMIQYALSAWILQGLDFRLVSDKIVLAVFADGRLLKGCLMLCCVVLPEPGFAVTSA